MDLKTMLWLELPRSLPIIGSVLISYSHLDGPGQTVLLLFIPIGLLDSLQTRRLTSALHRIQERDIGQAITATTNGPLFVNLTLLQLQRPGGR